MVGGGGWKSIGKGFRVRVVALERSLECLVAVVEIIKVEGVSWCLVEWSQVLSALAGLQ